MTLGGVSDAWRHDRWGLSDLSGKIIQDIRLQGHVHVDRPSHPAKLALSDIEHSLYTTSAFSGNLSPHQQGQKMTSKCQATVLH